VYLVVPANASRASLRLFGRFVERMRPSAVVVTKLDETGEPGFVLEWVSALGLPIAFLCDGQDVGAHLVRPRGATFADLLLRGRVS